MPFVMVIGRSLLIFVVVVEVMAFGCVAQFAGVGSRWWWFVVVVVVKAVAYVHYASVSFLRWSWVGPSSEHKLLTSLWKGRGGCSSSLASEGAVAVSMEPTSLSRGEGLAQWRSIVEVGGREGKGKGCGWWRKVRE